MTVMVLCGDDTETRERRAVLDALIDRYPYGLTPQEIRSRADLPHHWRANGIVRWLVNRGLAEHGYIGGRSTVWAKLPAAEARKLYRARNEDFSNGWVW